MGISHEHTGIWHNLYEELYQYRFELYFSCIIAFLFGSLFVTHEIFQSIFYPILIRINLLTGILLISKKKNLLRLQLSIFGISLFIFGLEIFQIPDQITEISYVRLGINFLFFTIVAWEIILQVWKAERVNNHVIFGLMNGFISIGLIGFFILLAIELSTPGSFHGLKMDTNHPEPTFDSLIYFSFITLLTVGYGDIYPLTPVAQRATIFIGMMGQFYLVILTAVVVEKYIRHNHE
ncbi:MAG: potassium channel family protein, partial [Bacteroidota bacterium]